MRWSGVVGWLVVCGVVATTLVACSTTQTGHGARGRDARWKDGGTGEEDVAGTRFSWPLDRGRLTSRFGPRGGAHHDGVDIAAPRGLPVVAAAPGEVLYAGRLRGYGNVVILDHGDGYASVYAHNEKNVVRAGTRVGHRAPIATVGQTGQASGPHLHFEIRKNNVARDPLPYLPAPMERTASLRR